MDMSHMNRISAVRAVALIFAAPAAMSKAADDRQSFAPRMLPKAERNASAPLLLATWSAGQDVGGWYIRDADTKIYMKSEKKAKRAAKKFNKMEKEVQDFKADDSGACDDPKIHC